MKTISLLLILSFFVSFAYHDVVAQTSETTDDDKTDEDKTDETTETHHEEETETDEVTEEEEEKSKAFEREYHLEKKDKEFKLESEAKAGDQKDEIEIELKAGGDDELEFELEYFTRTGNVETSLEFEFEFERLIEYKENGTELGYQEGEEVSEMEIGKQGWKNLVYQTVNQTEVIIAETSDGVFSMVIRYSASIIKERNFTLTPNSLKIDVIITDFPYTQAGTSLAIESKIETSAQKEIKESTFEEENGFSEREKEVKLIAGEYAGYFSWAEFAIADGKEINVTSSSIQDDDEETDLEPGQTSSKLYFSFIVADAKKIVWDPKLGVISVSAQQALSQLLGAAESAGLPLPFNFWSMLMALAVPTMALQFIRKRRS